MTHIVSLAPAGSRALIIQTMRVSPGSILLDENLLALLLH